MAGLTLPAGVTFRRIVEAWTALGAVVYVIGWVFFALFYAEFDVTPEQAGITFGFIVVRVVFFVVVAATLTTLTLALFSDRVSRFMGSGQWRMSNRVFLGAFAVTELLVVAILSLGASAWRPWSAAASPWNFLIASAVAAICVGLVVLVGYLLLSEYRGLRQVVTIPPMATVLIGLTVIGSLVLGPLLVVAPRLAADVRTGGEFAVFGVRINKVRVEWHDPSSPSGLGLDPRLCATVLGKADGTWVLYFAKTRSTLLVDSQDVTLLRPVGRPCSRGRG